MKQPRRVTVVLFVATLLSVATLSVYTVHTQVVGGESVRTIYNDVWDRVNTRLMTTPWAGAAGSNETEQTILNDVWDHANHRLNVSGGGGAGGSASFADVTSGSNSSAAMVVDTGASLGPNGSGQIVATSMDAAGLSGTVPSATLPALNLLTSGLATGKCVETDATTGKLKVATAACNTGAGGSGTWGGITGTLSNQTDLQAALTAKVDKTTTVNGHALTSNVAVTAGDLGLSNVNNTSDAQKNSDTVQVTNHQIVPRVQALVVGVPSPNQVTPNMDNTDVGYNYTFTAPLTINTPTFTLPLVDNQLHTLEFKTAAPQALTFGAGYSAECGLPLPTSTTGDGTTYNRFLFRYSINSTKHCLIATTKGDVVRVTTLGTSATYSCNADNSDQCEMTNTAATNVGITVQPPGGSLNNGQWLHLAFRCTVAAQTLTWDTVFVDSATFTKPTTCPLDSAKWLSVDIRYSTVITKWQLVRGEVVGATNTAKTDQANTYTTGAQNLAAATSFTMPSSAAAAPTSAGQLAYDTTQEIPKFGENGLFSSSPTRTLFVGEGGNTNTASVSTADVDHTGTTVTLPANYLLQHRILRICTFWRFTTSASPPSMIFRLKLGGVIVVNSGNITAVANSTDKSSIVCHMVLIKDVPGGSANVYASIVGDGYSFVQGGAHNNLATPVAIATNASVPVVVTSKWNLNTAANSVTPDWLSVEALN